MSLDPSGSRLVTGGVDYDMKMWDFAAMDASLHSFRSLQPCERYCSVGQVFDRWFGDICDIFQWACGWPVGVKETLCLRIGALGCQSICFEMNIVQKGVLKLEFKDPHKYLSTV